MECGGERKIMLKNKIITCIFVAGEKTLALLLPIADKIVRVLSNT